MANLMKTFEKLLLSLLLVFASCGKPKEKISSFNYQDDEAAISADLSERDIWGATQSLKLGDVGQDPQVFEKYGVGISQYIRIKEVSENSNVKNVKYGATTCTASLLEDGHVITAAHCMPKAVLDGSTSCRNLVFLHKKAQKPYRCESILWYSPVYRNTGSGKVTNSYAVSADLAIFKLSQKPKDLKAMKLSVHAALDSMRLNPLLYTPEKSSTESRMLFNDSKLCHLKDSARYGYAFRVVDQEFVQGNSGSPIINENEEIQFIISSIFKGKGESFVVDVSCLGKRGSEYFWKSSCEQRGPLFFKNNL